ncbi:hypothetical protein [Algoriphagus vanfongensis]|uniref:hypothetical protein n=1 Tax=Algoriphagus vanfongensis TaxID=426371 RepID=UPI00040D6867|nr:hypothetical protein [Algoriphagus vanfongensis]
MLKRQIVFATFLFISIIGFAQAQIKAVTERGDTIYVYNNGTWSYELSDQNSQNAPMAFLDLQLQIEPVTTPFYTPNSSSKSISNQWEFFDIFYDEAIWKRVPAGELNEDAEFAFQARKTDIWSVVISEETPIAKETLLKIAKNTMEENTGATVEVIKIESRIVNDKDLLRGVLKANYSGITFIFDSYYYSDDRGSVQFTTWSSENVWKKNETLILNLLNGFDIK